MKTNITAVKFALKLALALILVLGLLSCARQKARDEQIRKWEAQNEELEQHYEPEAIPDWSLFYVAMYNEDQEQVDQLLANGFQVNDYRDNFSESLYFEIYHSIQGFESRYLNGPLDSETERYYTELEDRLIDLFARFQALGFKPTNKGDLLSAAAFREFPRLKAMLEQSF